MTIYTKISIATLLAVTLSTSVIAGAAKGKPFIVLQDQIVEVEGAISTIEDQITTLIGDVSSMDARLAAVEAAIASLTTQNTVLQGLINDAETTITAINAKIFELETADDDQSALIITLQLAIAQLGTDQTDLATNLQGQIDHNSNLIAAMQVELDSESEWQTFQTNLSNGICPGGQAVTAVLPNGSKVCSNVGGSGSGTGTMETFTSFGDTMHLGAGTWKLGLATCPVDSVVTSTQWVSGGANSRYLRFTQTYTHGSADAWQPNNSARIVAYNSHPTHTVSFRAAATCMRIVP